MADPSPVHLVKGSDEVLLAKGAHDLIDRLVGDADRNEVLSEFAGDDYTMGDVLIAASTMSMFGSRVVVARNASRFSTDDLAPLVAYLQDPAPDSVVVVVWDKPVTAGRPGERRAQEADRRDQGRRRRGPRLRPARGQGPRHVGRRPDGRGDGAPVAPGPSCRSSSVWATTSAGSVGSSPCWTPPSVTSRSSPTTSSPTWATPAPCRRGTSPMPSTGATSPGRWSTCSACWATAPDIRCRSW